MSPVGGGGRGRKIFDFGSETSVSAGECPGDFNGAREIKKHWKLTILWTFEVQLWGLLGPMGPPGPVCIFFSWKWLKMGFLAFFSRCSHFQDLVPLGNHIWHTLHAFFSFCRSVCLVFWVLDDFLTSETSIDRQSLKMPKCVILDFFRLFRVFLAL